MNRSERAVKEGLEAIGFGVLRGGWPDFLVTKDGKVYCAVEVKSGFYGEVEPHQKIIHDVLRAAGIKVHVVHESRLAAFLQGLREANVEWLLELKERRRVAALVAKAVPSDAGRFTP